MVLEYPTNVILLLLQIVLHRQQVLVHRDKTLNLDELLKQPVVDQKVVDQFTNHKLVKLYAPALCEESDVGFLRSLLDDVFAQENANTEGPVTVITLANKYYAQRIVELEELELPRLKEEIKKQAAL